LADVSGNRAAGTHGAVTRHCLRCQATIQHHQRPGEMPAGTVSARCAAELKVPRNYRRRWCTSSQSAEPSECSAPAEAAYTLSYTHTAADSEALRTVSISSYAARRSLPTALLYRSDTTTHYTIRYKYRLIQILLKFLRLRAE